MLKKMNISRVIIVTTCAVFLVGAALNILLVAQAMRQQSLREAEAKAKILLDRNMATHEYFSRVMKPRLLAWSAPFREKGHFEPSWMSSTYAVREIHKYFAELNKEGYYIKDAAINARSPENEADEFERAYLRRIAEDATVDRLAEIRLIDGKPYLTVLRRGEVVEGSCHLCHSEPSVAPDRLTAIYGNERSFHRKIGETISAISMHIPLSDAYESGQRVTLQLSLLLAAVLAALFGIQYLLYRRFLLAPLRTVRDRARRLADGSEGLDREMPPLTGAEFNELGNAFDAMSRKLQASMELLEERVAARTQALSAVNAELEQEVAERRRAEEALKQSERHLRLSIGNMLEAYALHEALFGGNGRMVDYRFIEINPAAERILNVSRDGIVGRTALERYPGVAAKGLLERYAAVMATGAPAVIDGFHYLGDGLDRVLDITCFRIDERHFACVFRDVTERLRAEAKVRASLQEKETMLREIHHRVKNNLQVISSLLSIQSRNLKHEGAREALRESMGRVKTMAAVHTQLYQSEDLARVDFGRFVRDLVAGVGRTFGGSAPRVETQIDAEMSLGLGASIPCGLILNELVTNALKHAFPKREGTGGVIEIRIRREGEGAVMIVRDNGIGIPATVDRSNPKTLGLELVQILVRQLNGRLELASASGTEVIVTFPLNDEGEKSNG